MISSTNYPICLEELEHKYTRLGEPITRNWSCTWSALSWELCDSFIDLLSQLTNLVPLSIIQTNFISIIIGQCSSIIYTATKFAYRYWSNKLNFQFFEVSSTATGLFIRCHHTFFWHITIIESITNSFTRSPSICTLIVRLSAVILISIIFVTRISIRDCNSRLQMQAQCFSLGCPYPKSNMAHAAKHNMILPTLKFVTIW